MMGTNCSYTPILMLVLPEHLQPLSKGLCLFLGQPQSCVLVRPRSSQLAQSGGWGDRRRRWWHRRDKACDKRCQCRTCCSICPSQVPFTHHSPLPLPGSLEGNSLQFAWTAGIIFFFASCAVLSVLHLRLDEMRLFSAFHCLALKSLLPSLHRAL